MSTEADLKALTVQVAPLVKQHEPGGECDVTLEKLWEAINALRQWRAWMLGAMAVLSFIGPLLAGLILKRL